MVQRKVPDKLGIPQADDVNIFKKSLLGSPRSTCYVDHGKISKGPDLKKKMKRSTRSFKLSDSESLKTSSPFRRSMKQPLVKAAASCGSPNYMKATTCSEARKERSQVSSPSINTRAASVNSKPIRSLKRTSSLKLARTLTKTPSFKQVKRISKVGKICGDVNVRKPTCSSTLKDTKFPAYLRLSAGATEAEGTSSVKVCPYTYCSLNGHYHAPLPPLKCFLKAKRREMKTLPKPISSDGTQNNSGVCPLQLAGNQSLLGAEDFFIEIYTKSIGHDDPNQNQPSKSPSDASQRFSEEFKLENYNDAAEHMNGRGDCVEDAVLDIDYQSISGQEAIYKKLEIKSGVDEKEQVSTEEEDSVCEATDMEWEEGKYTELENDADGGYWENCGDDAQIIFEFLSVIKKISPKIINSDGFEEIVSHEELEELFDEETASLDMQMKGFVSDLEMDEMSRDWQVVESDQIDDCLSYYDHNIPWSWSEELDNEIEIGGMTSSTSLEDSLSLVDSETNIHISLQEHALDCLPADKAEDQDGTNVQPSFPIWTSDSSGSQTGENQDKAKESNTKTHMENVACQSQTDEATEVNEDGTHMKNVACQTDENSTDISCQTDEDTQVHDTHKQGDFSCQTDQVTEDIEVNHDTADDSCQTESYNHQMEEDSNEVNKFKYPAPLFFDESSNSDTCTKGPFEDSKIETETMEVKLDNEETNIKCTSQKFKGTSVQELSGECNDRKWSIGCKKAIKDSQEEREFNPRDPNFLSLPVDPEAEKVDLRHQMMDDRKNAEDWMLDHALQQTVTKLGPARKRKVALLVEAFETVLPIPKYQTHIRQSSPAFTHSRPIHACS